MAEGVAAGRVIVTVTVMVAVAVAVAASAAADEDEVGIVGSLAAWPSPASLLQLGRQFHKVSKQMTSVCGCKGKGKGLSTAG